MTSCLNALSLATRSDEVDSGSDSECEDEIEEDLTALITDPMSYLDMADEDCTTVPSDSTGDTPDRVHIAVATPE